ncbi:MAG: hypothetical protein CVU02_00155 [Bacteroidetes bacterium HGW-Bacteroidetes-19]|nr:MAG: hypothetical protein CVU04_02950 [Bacteroidetes bacterium HGW-Bacteroidetes-20]PKP28655.1 MAG: hypothetical protein CVU02_00155 [Bacteroidetes bacterium HGW-Bacteroidetes-19]
MKLTHYHIDETFDFEGTFGMPSKCGLKIKDYEDKKLVIVTELYQDNPGTSITSVTSSLAQQICQKYGIDCNTLIYLECAPGMNSKLNFYDEAYYKVDFQITNNTLQHPKWTKLNDDEKNRYL